MNFFSSLLCNGAQTSCPLRLALRPPHGATPLALDPPPLRRAPSTVPLLVYGLSCTGQSCVGLSHEPTDHVRTHTATLAHRAQSCGQQSCNERAERAKKSRSSHISRREHAASACSSPGRWSHLQLLIRCLTTGGAYRVRAHPCRPLEKWLDALCARRSSVVQTLHASCVAPRPLPPPPPGA